MIEYRGKERRIYQDLEEIYYDVEKYAFPTISKQSVFWIDNYDDGDTGNVNYSQKLVVLNDNARVAEVVRVVVVVVVVVVDDSTMVSLGDDVH
jgi:hypothetical protein